ncbi:hypothetical protein [Methylophilus sp.]|uniref:hypothetical protein n=1 Tax=Methylophilus sp. TaxID=29541 RepID=UPI00403676DE
MVAASATPLFESQGYTLSELFIKIEPQAYTQWGYLLTHPDRSFSVFNDKVIALQHLELCLHGELPGKLQASPDELILQEDMTSSPSTSSLITTDQS